MSAHPMVAFDGTVYADGVIMHPRPQNCLHQGPHACPTCDFDGYYANKYQEVCPWFDGDE